MARGLSATGTLWLSAQEVQLRKRIEGLDQLEKRYRGALQQEKNQLARNELIRAQLQQAEAAHAGSKETPPAKPIPFFSARVCMPSRVGA